jgi:hypothetical protein
MNTGAMDDVVYILTSASQFGSSKLSLPKNPAVMITVEIFVDTGIDVASVWPQDGDIRSMFEIQVTDDGCEGGVLDRDVPKTVCPTAAYCEARLAPRPRVAPTIRTQDIVIEKILRADRQRERERAE